MGREGYGDGYPGGVRKFSGNFQKSWGSMSEIFNMIQYIAVLHTFVAGKQFDTRSASKSSNTHDHDGFTCTPVQCLYVFRNFNLTPSDFTVFYYAPLHMHSSASVRVLACIV